MMNAATQLKILLDRGREQQQQWQRLWRCRIARPPSHRHQGMATMIMQDFQKMQLSLGEDGLTVFDTNDMVIGQIQCMTKQQWLHILREGCRHVALTRLQGQSTLWSNATIIDITGSMKTWRGLHMSHPLHLPMALMHTNALATMDKLYKAGQTSTSLCAQCGDESADQEHVIWECKHWQRLRSTWPIKRADIAAWPKCARSCLLIIKEAPLGLAGHWGMLVTMAAQLVADWLEDNRRRRRAEQDVDAHEDPTDAARPGPGPYPYPLAPHQGAHEHRDHAHADEDNRRSEPRDAQPLDLCWCSPHAPGWRAFWRTSHGFYNQIFRYLAQLRISATSAHTITWHELMMDKIAVNGMHLWQDDFDHELSVNKLAWRLRTFTSKILAEARLPDRQCDFPQNQLQRIHGALPPVSVALWGVKAIYPHKVREMINMWVTSAWRRAGLQCRALHVGTISDILALVPQNWKSNSPTLSSASLTPADIVRINVKSAPPTWWAQVREHAAQRQEVGHAEDPGGPEGSTTPLDDQSLVLLPH